MEWYKNILAKKVYGHPKSVLPFSYKKISMRKFLQDLKNPKNKIKKEKRKAMKNTENQISKQPVSAGTMVTPAKTISILNNKGGVGKTTTANILACLLSTLNKRVLLVDCDESGNLSLSYHHYVEDPLSVLDGMEPPEKFNIAELFRFRYQTKEEVQKVIYSTKIAGVDIIPSSERHKHTPNHILQSQRNNNVILKKALQTIKNDYDFILLDNAPADNILTVNSMFASDYVLIPLCTENYSYRGLCKTLNNLNCIIEEYELHSLAFLGAFFTCVNPQTNIFKEMMKQCREDFSRAGLQEKLFQTYIRSDTKINRINASFRSIRHYPESNALMDYASLLLETGLLEPPSAQTLKEAIS